MRELCSVKIRLDAWVQVNRAGDKPDAVASSHPRGFLDLGETQDPAIEFSRTIFSTGGDRHLYVIEIKDGHRCEGRRTAYRPPKAKHRNSSHAVLKLETS